MKEFFNKLFNKINIFKTIVAFMLIILGICLICVPTATLLTVCYMVGGFILAFGIFNTINYFVYKTQPFSFINGICELSIGSIVIIFAPQITSPQTFAIFAGIILLFSGLFRIQNSIDYKKFNMKNWWLYMIYGILLVAFSIVLMIYPFTIQKFALIFLGVVLLIDGIMKLVSLLAVKDVVKSIKDSDEDNVIIIEKDEDSN